MFRSDSRTSAKTGVAPAWTITFTVAGQVSEVVITSSPASTPIASSARWSAAVPEATASTCFASRYSAARCSSSAAFGPVVSQPERSVSETASISSSPIAGGWKPRKVARRSRSTGASVSGSTRRTARRARPRRTSSSPRPRAHAARTCSSRGASTRRSSAATGSISAAGGRPASTIPCWRSVQRTTAVLQCASRTRDAVQIGVGRRRPRAQTNASAAAVTNRSLAAAVSARRSASAALAPTRGSRRRGRRRGAAARRCSRARGRRAPTRCPRPASASSTPSTASSVPARRDEEADAGAARAAARGASARPRDRPERGRRSRAPFRSTPSAARQSSASWPPPSRAASSTPAARPRPSRSCVYDGPFWIPSAAAAAAAASRRRSRALGAGQTCASATPNAGASATSAVGDGQRRGSAPSRTKALTVTSGPSTSCSIRQMPDRARGERALDRVLELVRRARRASSPSAPAGRAP